MQLQWHVKDSRRSYSSSKGIPQLSADWRWRLVAITCQRAGVEPEVALIDRFELLVERSIQSEPGRHT
jgi:hypothetical protein